MPAPSGDRFSSSNMTDCAFCPPEGRRFRTQRQCAGCGKPLCLVCRVWIPASSFLCPDCGGGPCEDAIHQPSAAVQRIEAAGQTVPYWLLVLHQTAAQLPSQDTEELIVPE